MRDASATLLRRTLSAPLATFRVAVSNAMFVFLVARELVMQASGD